MAVLIEEASPPDWRELQEMVAQILKECGMEAETDKPLELARGTVDVDVYARDKSSLPLTVIVECKLWQRAVPKTVVHSLRTVVADAGVNSGLIVSSAGFQSGAEEAARYSTVRLVDWEQFQTLFVERWFTEFMAPSLRNEVDPLVEYTEPINSRIFRKAGQLTDGQRLQFQTLREKYFALALGLVPLWFPLMGSATPPIPELPLRSATYSDSPPAGIADEVLDAIALRPLMKVLIGRFRAAIAEFDEVFGERA